MWTIPGKKPRSKPRGFLLLEKSVSVTGLDRKPVPVLYLRPYPGEGSPFGSGDGIVFLIGISKQLDDVLWLCTAAEALGTVVCEVAADGSPLMMNCRLKAALKAVVPPVSQQYPVIPGREIGGEAWIGKEVWDISNQ